MKYTDIIYGRNEVTLTIFVPWDCCSNCKFCTTKNEYRNINNETTIEENTRKICDKLDLYTQNNFFTHIVFTGGEPFRDISRLDRIVNHIHGNKKIYVNTSFSFAKNESHKLNEAIEWVSENRNKIGVSISRPLKKGYYSNENMILQTIDVATKLKMDFKTYLIENDSQSPFRMNSYVDMSESSLEISKFISKWGKFNFFKQIAFRSDYTETTPETLHSSNDPFFGKLMGMKRLDFLGSSQCLVCHTDMFKDNDSQTMILYHRGLKTTSLIFNKKLIINDVVMKQDGSMLFDWEGKNVSIDLNKQISKEILEDN